MMCGKNGNEITNSEFLAGCNRFGLDNPTPIINHRLAPYGNAENMEKILDKMARKYQGLIDADRFVGTNPDKNNKTNWDELEIPLKAENPHEKDMHETKVPKRHGKKVSGVHDIKMLDRLENAKKFESPAHVILARGIANIKIKDIAKNTTLRGKVAGLERDTNLVHSIRSEKQILVPSFGTTGALFARHFDIMDKLKRRILLLKQAYDDQRDPEKMDE